MMNIDYSVETWDSFIEKRNSLESLKFIKGDNSENENLVDKEAGKYIISLIIINPMHTNGMFHKV